jgi:hypothetical protein
VHVTDDVFEASIRSTLAPDEELVATAEVFDIHTRRNGHGHPVLERIEPFTLAMTTVSLRRISFAWRRDGVFATRWFRTPRIDGIRRRPLGFVSESSIERRALPYAGLKSMLTQRYGVSRPDVLDVISVTWRAGTSFSCWAIHSHADALWQAFEADATARARAESQSSIASAIEKLVALRQRGALTDDEFALAKAGILGTTPDHAARLLTRMRHLHDLRRDGALSEGMATMALIDHLARLERL